MKDYRDYSVDDFIADDRFIKWVKFPDEETNDFWSGFISENPDKVPAIEHAIRFLELFSDQRADLAEEHLLRLQQQVHDRIDVPVSASTVHQIIASRSERRRNYLYAAAVSVALLAFGLWWLVDHSISRQSIETVSVQEEYSMDHLQEHVIPKGKRSRITLQDGTQVWLNADSRLQYSPGFLKGTTRDVYLQGEAFFDVSPDKSHPFIVHVQGISIKVLGTSFNVKGYDGEPRIEATLVHGRISIAGDSVYDHVTLAANQRAVFLKEKKGLLVENNVATDSYTSWRRGILVFEDQPLYEILPTLERAYNVSIHTDNTYSLDCRFTAKINNKSLQEVLELFRTSDTIEYSIVGRDVYIRGSFCNE